ncbi:Putative pentatricopeptide repeat-containing protein [Apostasia shenzhenica]|uniref:Pentatricopeptide repeat-containing protein n=1 Tax=Apostasia shenzhenica TaxID=1088818 RepID=A0A2I0AEC1_9ASPA|nr:Putative pentatricopeptide repeat-containing protein [Apostasia shenzhenica]
MARKWSRAKEECVASLLDLCASPRQLKQVCAHVVANGQSQNNFLAAKMVRAFAEMGCVESSRVLAQSISSPNIFVWTALIRGYSLQPGLDNSQEAVLLYQRLHRIFPPVRPLSFTLSSVLKACAEAAAIEEGRQVHAHGFKDGFQLDGRLQTSLVNFYGRCGRLADARQVFDVMLTSGVDDIQAWNTLISRYAEAGSMEAARSLFDGMPAHNTHTLVAMIAGYAATGEMEHARQLVDAGLLPSEKNSVLCTAMITGYSRCGDLLAARAVFDGLGCKDVASWNAMIAAYAHAGFAGEAVGLFRQMLDNACEHRAEPNETTIATVASACAQFGSPNLARWLQTQIDRRGEELLNSHTVAALIDLHSKCGDLRRAYDLFCRWNRKDLVCYSSMIAGFGIHGCGREAIGVFEELKEANLKPDAVCFVSLLAACSHCGMVEEGRRYFELMTAEYGILPAADHYICLVDLLGRAGRVDEAYRLIAERMPPWARLHAGVWGALLSACRSFTNVEIGEEAGRRLMEMEPENAGNYVLLANIYAMERRWEEAARVRGAMRRRGMKKPPAWSLAEGEGGGERKFMTGEAYEYELETVLQLLRRELKDQGYIPGMEEAEE